MKRAFLCLAALGLWSLTIPVLAVPRLCGPLDPAIDADADCIRDDEEELRGISPALIDSDFDGVVDGDEALGSYFNAVTFANDSDTDDDGLSDGMEAELQAVGFIVNPISDDADFDGISDLQEIMSRCGNGNVETPEQCDDGDLAAGNGCSPFCTAEFCGNNILDAGEQCDDGGLSGAGDFCDSSCRLILPSCQDGEVNSPAEQCDNGADEAGDGCNIFCRVQVCGDAFVDFDVGEECDPGIDLPNDGCDEDCRLIVVEPSCGDGIVQGSQSGGSESCDDGNAVAGDGCDADCRSERCGDGIVQREGAIFEECDDGNVEDGDNCDSLCQVNVEFIPPGQPGQSAEDPDAIRGGGSCAFQPGDVWNSTANLGFLVPVLAFLAIFARPRD